MNDPLIALANRNYARGCATTQVQSVEQAQAIIEAHREGRGMTDSLLKKAQAVLLANSEKQPDVLFERCDYDGFRVVFGDVVAFYPFATWAINDIDCMSHMSTEELIEEVCSK